MEWEWGVDWVPTQAADCLGIQGRRVIRPRLQELRFLSQCSRVDDFQKEHQHRHPIWFGERALTKTCLRYSTCICKRSRALRLQNVLARKFLKTELMISN